VLQNILLQPVKALILLSYGVGNAPQSQSVLAQLKQAADNDIIVLNCTQCMHGKVNMHGYVNGHILEDAGVISGSDMTPEAALAKLHFLLSQKLSLAECKNKLLQDLRGELSAS